MNIEKSHWSANGEDISLSVPFTKVNREKRTVSGFATLDNLDQTGDVVTAEASLGAFENFRGNIREMHGSNAVGKMVSFIHKLLGLRVRGDVGDSLLHSVDLLCLGIRNLHREFVLEGHHHLLTIRTRQPIVPRSKRIAPSPRTDICICDALARHFSIARHFSMRCFCTVEITVEIQQRSVLFRGTHPSQNPRVAQTPR